MRATRMIQKLLEPCRELLHAKTLSAVQRFCKALLSGKQLTLSQLGRAAGGTRRAKHRIKAADRLLGNAHVRAKAGDIYRALAYRWLALAPEAPILLVDWTALPNKFYALTASVAFQGRSVPLYSEVYPEKKKTNRRIEARFLRRLKKILPGTCRAIVVTDAGFYTEWCDALEELGWHFVARVRNKTMYRVDERSEWKLVKTVHAQATKRPRSLGRIWLTKTKPRSRTLILARRPKPPRYRNGGHWTNANKCRSRANEPWVLATNLDAAPRTLVKIYARRMQIEQNFRDLKDSRWGWRLHHARSRSADRFAVLLLLATIAIFAVLLIALTAEQRGLHRSYQANTRKRRVLSLFNLGNQLIADNFALPISLRAAIEQFAANLIGRDS